MIITRFSKTSETPWKKSGVDHKENCFKMDFGLSSSVIKKLQEVFESFREVNKVVIYGSRAKANFREGSDIDLTLFGENLDLKKLQKIELEIDELYLPYKLDLSLFHQISNLDLIEHINRVGKIFYQKEKTTSN